VAGEDEGEGEGGAKPRVVTATLMPLAGPGSTVIDPWSPHVKPREVGEGDGGGDGAAVTSGRSSWQGGHGVVEVVVAESMEGAGRWG
jgi:hypothetical protein